MPNYFKIVLLPILFCAALIFPILNSQLELVIDSENLENRRLAPEPAFDVQLLDPFPAQYEKFYDDHFSVRSLLVKFFNLFNLYVFKKSPFPDLVIVGERGWLFLASNDIDTYLGKNRLQPFELESLRLELEYRRDLLKKKGCEFYVMVAPGKPTIYPENVPYTYYRYHRQSWGEQLLSHLRKFSNIKTVDLYEVFRQNKEKQLYYKLDTHWNNIGATYAAEEFFKITHNDFPSLRSIDAKRYSFKKTEKKLGNCVKILGFPPLFNDAEYDFVPPFKGAAIEVPNEDYPFMKQLRSRLGIHTRKKKDAGGLTLLLAGDSFCDLIFPLLAEQFDRTIYTFDYWEYKFNEDIVNSEQPSAYLLLIHEPLLRSILGHQARSSAKK